MSYVQKNIINKKEDFKSDFLDLMEELFYTNIDLNYIDGVILLNDDIISRQCMVDKIIRKMNYQYIEDSEKKLFVMDVQNITQLCLLRKLLYMGIVNKNIKLLIIKNIHSNLKNNAFKTRKFVKIISDIRKYTQAPILITGHNSIKEEFAQINYFNRKFKFICF